METNDDFNTYGKEFLRNAVDTGHMALGGAMLAQLAGLIPTVGHNPIYQATMKPINTTIHRAYWTPARLMNPTTTLGKIGRGAADMGLMFMGATPVGAVEAATEYLTGE